jgi:hypothetical protein
LSKYLLWIVLPVTPFPSYITIYTQYIYCELFYLIPHSHPTLQYIHSIFTVNCFTWYLIPILHYNIYTVYLPVRGFHGRMVYSYNYLCNQSPSPLMLWVHILLGQGVLDTTVCDKISQSLATGQWFSHGTPVSSTN